MSEAMLRVVLLCRDDPSSRIMFHALAPHFEIARVIVEGKPPALAFLRTRARNLGWATVAGQVLFLVLNRFLRTRDRNRIADLHRFFRLDDAAFPAASVVAVGSVNSSEAVAALVASNPEAVVVNGTRILGPQVLSAVSAPFINTHMGITPRYRGVHGGYWALANQDPAHCGVTVHLVDSGIDTGAILYQDRIEPTKDDSFNTYPVHQIGKALPMMKAALSDVAAGTLAPRAAEGPSGLWSHPTVLQYLRIRMKLGVR